MTVLLALLVLPVVSAVLVRVALLRWTRCRVWTPGVHAIAIGVLTGLCALLLLLSIVVAEWVTTNGASWAGTCPGGPPDIGTHPCVFSEAAVRSFSSPFALPWLLLCGVYWALASSATWVAQLLRPLPADGAPMRTYRVGQALGIGVNAAFFALWVVVGIPIGFLALSNAWDGGRVAVHSSRPPP